MSASVLVFGDGAWATDSVRVLFSAGYQIIGMVLRVQPTGGTLQTLADEMNLPTYCPADVNDPSFVQEVATARPTLCLSISYDQYLGRALRSVPSKGFINFHAGLLPRYRGRNAINWALINGEEIVGLTAHFVDGGIDTGDILLQRSIPVGWTDEYGDVFARAVDNFPSLVVDTVEGLLTGMIEPFAQDHSRATYFPKRQPGDEWIDWSDSSLNIYNKIRAIAAPGPGARTAIEGKEIILWRAVYDPSWPNYIAISGEVVGRTNEGSIVKTGDSTIVLISVQEGDGEPVTPTWPVGTRFEGVRRG